MRSDFALAAICVLAMLIATPAVHAQAPASPKETRLYLGMWTTHLNANKPAIDPNWLVAVSNGHVFGGTFTNSFGRRAFTAGFQQQVARIGRGPLRDSVGFRIGAVSGYDERFMKLAKNAPVLPMLQVYNLFEVGRLGTELTVTWVVASVAFAIRF